MTETTVFILAMPVLGILAAGMMALAGLFIGILCNKARNNWSYE